MRRSRPHLDRRMFIKGAFGVTFSLPLLEGLLTRNAAYAADPNAKPVYAVFVRAGNGVAQQAGSEPERFWPLEMGALSAAMLQRQDSNNTMRAVGELSEFAQKLLIVQGLKYNFPGNGCGHSGGGNQCLTNTPPSGMPERNKSLATGESLDNLIQRTLMPSDPEPLTLAAGRESSYLDEVLSFNLPLNGDTNGRLRSAERNPWAAYKNLFGDPSDQLDDVLYNLLAEQRKSVNDVVREQINDLKRHPALSQRDLQRLELHQDNIRDLEKKMLACHLPTMQVQTIRDAGDRQLFKDHRKVESLAMMQMDIIALAFACDLKRAATLQIGNGNDQTIYDIGQPNTDYPFHWISHRIQGDGGSGSAPSIGNADYFHHLIDRVQMRMFKHLLSRLDEYQTDTGTLLDDSVAVWTNDLANGIGHGYRNVPYLIGGSGGGYLKQGQHVDARDSGTKSNDGWVSHGQLFNTILGAVGVRNADGSPIEDFGHKGGQGHNAPPGGELSGIKA